FYSFDSDLTPQVAVLQDAKGSQSPVYVRPGVDMNAASSTRQDEKPNVPPAPTLTTGRIRQAASFDGKSFFQLSGDIAGFDSYGSGRGAIGENDPTVTYDDAYTMSAWIYPTTPSGAIVTRDEDIFEPNGHGLNLRDGKIEYDYVTKWVDEGIRLRTEKA